MNVFRLQRSANIMQKHWRNQDKFKRFSEHTVKITTSVNDPIWVMAQKEYEDTLPAVVETLVFNSRLSQNPEVAQYMKKILDYNLRLTRIQYGMITMFAYKALETPEKITEEYIKISKVLGWCVDMLGGHIIILDDMMDGAATRQGKPCWYRRPEVGLSAANDATLLNCCIRETLEAYTKKTPHFLDFIKIFHQAVLYTCMGQCHDILMLGNKQEDYNMYTLERYKTMTRYKSGSGTYITAIKLALTLVTDVDEKIQDDFLEICSKLTCLYQMQNDYMDCYWNEQQSGKTSTDIQEGKCTWLSATALQLCNETQKERFIKYYGSKDPEHVSNIKRLYKELHLEEQLKQAQSELQEEILRNVRAIPWESAHNFFYNFLQPRAGFLSQYF